MVNGRLKSTAVKNRNLYDAYVTAQDALAAYEVPADEEALELMDSGRKSYSKTDPDATFMLKDDRMRNRQFWTNVKKVDKQN